MEVEVDTNGSGETVIVINVGEPVSVLVEMEAEADVEAPNVEVPDADVFGIIGISTVIVGGEAREVVLRSEISDSGTRNVGVNKEGAAAEVSVIVARVIVDG